MGQMRWFVRGDIDGFFGLALDNLVQLLVLSELCRTVLGFPDALVYGRILPGAAVSLLVGNLFYAWQAMRLARTTGRTDVCALPYGINTVSLFAYVFLVMLPAKLAAEAAGAADPAQVAWQAGLVACFGSGVIELLGSTVSERSPEVHAARRAALDARRHRPDLHRHWLPVPRLHPADHRARTRWRSSSWSTSDGSASAAGSRAAWSPIALGTGFAWLTGLAPAGRRRRPRRHSTRRSRCSERCSPGWPVGAGRPTSRSSCRWGSSPPWARSRTSSRPGRPATSIRRGISLAVNGVGTLAACAFGSCFPTTLYIGHPGWKALGARAGYSVLNGAFMTLICLTGHGAVDRLGGAHRCRDGHRAVDRHRHRGAGVPGDAARARAGGGGGPAAEPRGLGRLHGQGGPARRRARRAGRAAVLPGPARGLPALGLWMDGRATARAGIHPQQRDPRCGHGRR